MKYAKRTKVPKLGSNTSKERKKLIKVCDDLVSLIVRARDKYCVTCGTRERLTCSHLIKRGRAATRFDLVNCNCQCSACNQRHNYYPEHYTNWFLYVYGTEKYRELIKSAGEVKKWTLSDLRELKETLTAELGKVTQLIESA